MTKPELLLPAGSTEAFFAALEGGADAIYLGLQDFNARKSANNFTINQLPTLLKIAHEQKSKIYITLNTVIKNNELAPLLVLLSQLTNIQPDAIIIQDWGLFFLAKNYFPDLNIHASTQMAFHNSTGANLAKKIDIDRVILARELTYIELKRISEKSRAEIELFVHGALCYSFSGMCLFSSYLGGQSANRGACKQPCRRMFFDDNKKHFLFSLKDNELIEYIPDLVKMGITSLKVEGRMKSADYVYTIARAYRLALDHPERLEEAKEILSKDLAREKTSYFIGGKLDNALTESPNTGLYLGRVLKTDQKGFTFKSGIDINAEQIKRIRIFSGNGKNQVSLKIRNNIELQKDLIRINAPLTEIKAGNKVYLVGMDSIKFPTKLPEGNYKTPKGWSIGQANQKVKHIIKPQKPGKPKLYFRIDSPGWLRKIRLDNIDYLILNLTLKDWQDLKLDSPFLQKHKHKLIASLPNFISEENCDKYKSLCQRLYKQNINTFQINHISQLKIIPDKAKCISSEYIYIFNDAAISQLSSMGISNQIYPLENDLENLLSGYDRSGIVPLHFTPQLFFSRMPAKVDNADGLFKDDTNSDYQIVKRAGATITIPDKPVSLLQNKPSLTKKGFRNFLIDVSFTRPSQNTFKTLIKRYYQSEQFQPSSSFNFKKGLT